jgi:anaerobic selenocysteine-containing dehydrogenase
MGKPVVVARKSYCRICQAFCGTVVTLEDDRIIKVVGDHDDPLSRGYACFKGLQAPEQHNGPKRLRSSVRRAGGDLVPGPSEEILAEAGSKLRDIIDRHGPDSVALFTGTQALFNSITPLAIIGFADAIGTERRFNTMTIDQSAKWIAEARMGGWEGGPQHFESADTWMLFGSNPLVSMVAGAGASQFAFTDPVKTMKRLRDRGMQLIVIDPRRSETAKFAALHIQPKPGCDAMIAAAVLNEILQRGLHDATFCEQYVNGLKAFTAAVEPFTAERVAPVAGIDAGRIHEAVRIFTDAKTGMAGSGTGPDMARHSNIAEQLIQAINVVCGRYPRASDAVPNPGVLRPPQQPVANVKAPNREWLQGTTTVVNNLGKLRGVMMSAEIPNEIVEAGEGRIRALICVGGNLAVALPDQRRAEQALQSLDLLIVIDPRITATSRFADYVIAPRIMYERPDSTMLLEGMFQHPFGHVTDAVAPAPAGSDLVDEWYALYRLAGHAGFDMRIMGIGLSPDDLLSTEDLMEKLAASSRVPFDKLKRSEGALLVPAEESVTVAKRSSEARFELMADDVAEEIAAVAAELGQEDHQFRLIVRRQREVMNSLGADFDATRKRFGGNPAYMNPNDMASLGLADRDLVDLVRDNRSVRVHVRRDRDLRPGVISVSHAWSGNDGNPWEATNALVDADRDVQAINRMPVMTGIPVSVRPVGTSAG